MTSFTIEGYQILQIVEDATVHKLNIMNQIKQFSTFGGRGFDAKTLQQILDEMVEGGYITYIEKIDSYKITEKGKEAGGEFKYSKRFGPYFIWPADIPVG